MTLVSVTQMNIDSSADHRGTLYYQSSPLLELCICRSGILFRDAAAKNISHALVVLQ